MSVILEEKEYLSAREAADLSGYTPDYIARLCHDGEVAARRLGRIWYLERHSLRQFISKAVGQDKKRRTELRLERLEEFRKVSQTIANPVSRPSQLGRTIGVCAAVLMFVIASSLGYSSICSLLGIDQPLITTVTTFERQSPIPLGVALIGAHERFSQLVASAFTTDLGKQFLASAIEGLPQEAASLMNTIGVSIGKWLVSIFGGTDETPLVSAPAPLAPLTTTQPSEQTTLPAPQVIEHVVQPTTVVQNITRTVSLSGVSAEDLATKLNQLENKLRAFITDATSGAHNAPLPPTYSAGGYTNTIALSQKIDQLVGIAISGGTISDASISGGSIAGVELDAGSLTGIVGIDVGGTGTSSAPEYGQVLVGDGAGGYSLVASSTFGGGSGNVGSGTQGQLPFYDLAGTSLTATSSLTLSQAGLFGVGTTSPLSQLDVFGNLTISGSNRYLNFGDTSGINGYGFRDNNGIIELKNSGGAWGVFGSGGGGSSIWATTTNNLAIYPSTTSWVTLIGTNSTSTTGNILEVLGNSLLRGSLTVANSLTTSSLTATSTATSTSLAGGLQLLRLQTGTIEATSTTATSTIAGGLKITGGGLTISNISGFLKATVGAIANSLISLTADVTGILPIANGGTNASSFITNALTYFDGTRLSSTSTTPLYVGSLVATTTATSTFAGGIQTLNLQTGSLNATGTATSSIAGGLTITGGGLTINSISGFLKATAGAVANALINLTSDVTGTLPVGNGGTGQASLSAGQLLYGSAANGVSTVATGTIAAGTGISITGGPGYVVGSGITISASGGGSGTLSTSSDAVIGNLAYFTGVSTVGNVATTSVTCSGSTSCTAFTAIGGSPITISSSGGSSFSYPFDTLTTFGTTTYSTTTPLWARGPIYASSTATSTFNGGINITSGGLTISNISGFLKATAGAIANSLISLTADVTGILPIANGGTNASALSSGLLWFDGTRLAATSSQVTVGSIVSTTTATSTFVGGINALRFIGNTVEASDSAATSTLSGGLSVGSSLKTFLTNCDTIDTNALGYLVCGTDATSAGGSANSKLSTSTDATALYPNGGSIKALVINGTATSTQGVALQAYGPVSGTQLIATGTATSTSLNGGLQVLNLQTGSINATGTATSTIAGGLNITAGGLTISNISGFLKATVGAIANSLISLTSDITGILGIANGGTNASSLATGLLSFDGTRIVALSSAVTFGSFTATTTATSTSLSGGIQALRLQAGTIEATSTTASSTFANGISLTTGCFAIGTTCVTGGGGTSLSGGINNTFAAWTSGTTIAPTSTQPLYVGSVNATTTATSTFAGGLQTLNLQTGSLNATGTATSTIAGGLNITGGGLTISNISGFLKATVGAIANSLISLTADVTGILGIANGGTNASAISSNALLYFDGTRIAATSSTVYLGNIIGTTTATSTFLGAHGIGTTSPYARFAIQAATGQGNLPIFQIASTSDATPFLTVSGVGNLGIGTTTPFGLLSIQGSSTAAPTALLFHIASSSNNTPFFGITSALGYVGIGTSTPYSKLSVWGTGTGTKSLFELTNNASTTLASVLENGTAYFLGNLGIGTTSPGRRLSVSDTVSAAQFQLAYDGTRYANFQVNSTGDLLVDAQGANVRMNEDNLFVCTGGACPGSGGTPSGNGNIIAETAIGIGTSTPFWNLDVAGTRPSIGISDLNAPSSFKHWLLSSEGGNLYIGPADDSFATSSQGSAFTILAGGSVGIASTTPSAKLSVTGNGTGTGRLFALANNSSAEKFTVLDNGSVGVGTTSPTNTLSVGGKLFVSNGLTTNALGTATSTYMGDVKILGKLDVSTIDPIYKIDGVKYATYGASTVGVKEEVVQTVELVDFNKTTGKYEYAIDFPTLEKGSDFWLFYQITDWGESWKNLIVTLTPGFDGAVSYTKDVTGKRLILKASAPGEVSVRLIANRYDFASWPNLRPDQNSDFTHFKLDLKQ